MAKVLIVDDSAYARRVHRGILERGGYDVSEASSGTMAIETFAREHPDLVLLDLSMEDIGGLEVLGTIRQLDPSARVIVVSADVQRTTSAAALAGGAVEFLPKPAGPDQILAAVQQALRETPK
jgi:two-component system chemotaxis response regulator CheY